MSAIALVVRPLHSLMEFQWPFRAMDTWGRIEERLELGWLHHWATLELARID